MKKRILFFVLLTTIISCYCPLVNAQQQMKIDSLQKELPFTNHKIELQKGDSLYIFTDGYADQFGGPKGKKFKYVQLKEILLSIQNMPMLKQEELLMQKFNDWKGKIEQVDDILLIGIRV
jgi:serine phosphatase RsbU (regulator of sigma subunit)